MNTVTAYELRRMILDDRELALLDAREELRFAESHIFYASCCALSRLERLAPQLVPRRTARVVVCDAGGGEAARAAVRLRAFGYTGVSVLEGGVSAWTAAGYTLFSGVNVPSKAFGEVVEHELGTPSISAEELRAICSMRARIWSSSTAARPRSSPTSASPAVCVVRVRSSPTASTMPRRRRTRWWW